jgi:hypothetical protein
MDIYRIYDAGEGVLDRFVIYLKGRSAIERRGGYVFRECVIIRSNGDWEHSQGWVGRWNGRRVGIKDLPGEVLCTLNNLRYL